jgi:hypothetical protein
MNRPKSVSAAVSLTATLPLPPKTAKLLPPWVWKWWKETVTAARAETGLRPVGEAQIAWREPYRGTFGERGYEELALAIELVGKTRV